MVGSAMPSDPSESTTTVDSLLRAVARTPVVTTSALALGTVIDENLVLIEELGRGGMGVVYRARDRRLDRDVAVKLMRADRWAHVPREELVRVFEREARATARLRHPSIVTLHHAGEHDGALYLVLELLRGRTLASRLTRPLPLPVAITMMRAITSAVAHAHAEGVLHRDLKPQNIWVGDNDHVWILDFGLASLHAASALESATDVTSRGGTPAYMAPEQRIGAAQDATTDVWALGLLLYQMVTAHQPPPLVAAVDITRAPWSDDLARLPPSLARVIAGAVQWRSEDRFATVTAFADALDAVDVTEAAPRHSRVPWVVAGVAIVVAAAAILALWPGDRALLPIAARGPSIQFDIAMPPLDYAVFPQSPPIAVSPDGRTIIFSGRATGVVGAAMQLYRRGVSEAEALPIPDTSDAEGPAFSPDGSSLVYAKDGELWRRPLDGGSARALAPVHAGFRGVTWTDRDELVMAPSWFSPLVIAPANGGPVRPLTVLAAGEKTHRYPHALPGGKAVVFVVGDSRAEQFDDARVEWVNLETKERRVVTTGGAPRFVPPSTLLVPRAGAVWAVPFDPATGTVIGAETRVVGGVLTSPASGVAAFDVSAAGTLAYVLGDPAMFTTEVVRVDARGVATPMPVPARATSSVRALSRDRLLLRTDAANATMRLHDLARGIDTRLTWAWDADHAVVTPDDASLYLAVTRPDHAEIVRRRIDGTGDDHSIYVGRNPANLELSRDGTRLLFDERDARGAADIVYLELDKAPPALVTYQKSREHEIQPALSPNGRWLAYVSNSEGRDQIFVQSFPTPGVRIQLSATGGRFPRWRENGKELVYRAEREVLSVSVEEAGGTLVAGPPRRLFELDDIDEPARRTFDLVGADELVTVRRATAAARAERMRVIVNWQLGSR